MYCIIDIWHICHSYAEVTEEMIGYSDISFSLASPVWKYHCIWQYPDCALFPMRIIHFEVCQLFQYDVTDIDVSLHSVLFLQCQANFHAWECSESPDTL